jgi:hypothetical protein
MTRKQWKRIHCAEALNPQSIEFTGRLISPYSGTRHKRQFVKVSVVVILGIIPLQRVHARTGDLSKKEDGRLLFLLSLDTSRR